MELSRRAGVRSSWDNAHERSAPEAAAVCRRFIDILAALVETWHDGTASRCSDTPVFSSFKVVAACVYRAEFDVADVGACCSCWSGATRVFYHDFDDILERPSMSFVPRRVAGRGQIPYAVGAADLEQSAGQARNSLSLVVCRRVTKDTVKSSQPEEQSPKMS